ncbi:MAG: hypothetical protein AMJ69_09325 [Gammaproteobacteria bacterium SG8_47]|nr:MAG: hypothetical protein AMJ69_09325 [Gammaproteobacteria bacterium SG8_47]
MLAVLTLVPLGFALAEGMTALALRYLALVAALVLVAALGVRVKVTEHVQPNEALVIVALAFTLSPLLMSWPLAAAGIPFVDALFEAVSGITTTGLTTLVSLEDKPASFLFARAWMQWYGGLGIVVLSVALLMGHTLAGRRLAGPTGSEGIVASARTHARRMFTVYASLTVVGIALLWLLSGDGLLAVTHALAAVSTGGFSALEGSLADFPNWPLRYAVIALAFAGAIPLPLYYRLRQHGLGALRDPELYALLICTTAVAGWLWLTLTPVPGQSSLAHAILLGASAQTTAGFSSLDVAELGNDSKAILILAMFVGGGLGSTAGGVKLLRLLILLRVLHVLLQRAGLPPHAVLEPRLGGRMIERDDIERALMIVLLFIAVIVLSWLAFVAHGYPPFDALFEVVSATGTVGLSAGITSAELPALLKMILCFDMLLGRLEIVALLVVLYPRTWIGKRAPSSP